MCLNSLIRINETKLSFELSRFIERRQLISLHLFYIQLKQAFDEYKIQLKWMFRCKKCYGKYLHVKNWVSWKSKLIEINKIVNGLLQLCCRQDWTGCYQLPVTVDDSNRRHIRLHVDKVQNCTQNLFILIKIKIQIFGNPECSAIDYR